MIFKTLRCELKRKKLKFERYGLIYKRGCQEHFSPSTGGAEDWFATSSPSHDEDARGCRAPGLVLVIRSQQSSSSISGDDANQFRN